MIKHARALFLLVPLAAAPVAFVVPAQAAEAMSLDVCPSDYSGFPADGPRLTCGCTPDATKAGEVFGANPYYWQSSVCRAAVHAGILDAGGGTIVVTPAPAVPVYPAVARNAILGHSYRGGAENQGFGIAALPGAAPAVPARPIKAATSGLSLDVCPSDYGSFPADGPSLTCGCSPTETKVGEVFGANPYYWQSSVCRAAVHAGILDTGGGTIVVTPAPAVPVYPAVSRNGIASHSYRGGSENQGFKVVAVPGAVLPKAASLPKAAALPVAPQPLVDGSGQPIQAPVAETLQRSGQVALYIRFRFNSADLDISAAPTLTQLRDALMASPDLRLVLVGHTDAVGGRDYNRELSLKRAEAVMLWLRDQGVPAERLAIDGKGYEEPIADNVTDTGRALNRRVQAIRIP